MTGIFWAISKLILLGLVPYADPIRRRRARRSARALVSMQSWPMNDADATARNYAELALLRTLHLQSECRRAVRHRMPESAAALSRISIEVCLFGLYCVYHEDAIEKIKIQNISALRAVLNFLVTVDLISNSFLNDALTALESQKDQLSVYKLAKEIDANWGTSDARQLYSGYYAPLSTLFVHANGLSLIRYVRRNGKPTVRPRFPWIKRSAMHLVDACVALLAVALSEPDSTTRSYLGLYGEAHTKRILTPVSVIASLGVRSSWKLREAAPAIQAILDMRRYANSAQALDDSTQSRIERIGHGFDRILHAFKSDNLPEDVIEIFRDYLVNKIVDRIADHTSPGD